MFLLALLAFETEHIFNAGALRFGYTREGIREKYVTYMMSKVNSDVGTG